MNFSSVRMKSISTFLPFSKQHHWKNHTDTNCFQLLILIQVKVFPSWDVIFLKGKFICFQNHLFFYFCSFSSQIFFFWWIFVSFVKIFHFHLKPLIEFKVFFHAFGCKDLHVNLMVPNLATLIVVGWLSKDNFFFLALVLIHSKIQKFLSSPTGPSKSVLSLMLTPLNTDSRGQVNLVLIQFLSFHIFFWCFCYKLSNRFGIHFQMIRSLHW